MTKETLLYWKNRTGTARAKYNFEISKSNREELIMCKKVVAIIEAKLFERKKTK